MVSRIPPRELFNPKRDVPIAKPVEPEPQVEVVTQEPELDEDMLRELDQAMEVQDPKKEDITPSQAILKYRLK